MDESNLTKMSLQTDNRDRLCEEYCVNLWWKTQYPPWGTQLILCGLQRYIRQEWPQTPVNFTSHCHLHHNLHLKLKPIEELRCIDINELFAFESFRLVSLMIHV